MLKIALFISLLPYPWFSKISFLLCVFKRDLYITYGGNRVIGEIHPVEGVNGGEMVENPCVKSRSKFFPHNK